VNSQPLSADLRILKFVTSTSVTPGTNIVYNLEVRNLGSSAAENVTVTDAVPANTTFVSAIVNAGAGWSFLTQPIGGGTGNVVIKKATMAPDDFAVLQLIVRIDNQASGQITNTATVVSTTSDPVSSNNTAVTVTNLPAPPPLPSNVRTALLVPVDFRDFKTRSVMTNLPQTQVTFTNNIPQAGVLDKAFEELLALSGEGFGKITMADVIAPLDSTINDRLKAVAQIFLIAHGGVADTLSMLLSSNDKNALIKAAVDLTGIDEIIYLEVGILG
jgi:uncharacterized repeat protein (TIGR01451 family)